MDNKFEPRKSKENIELKYAHLSPETWEALAKLQRTGWVMRGIENPESVQEHTLALIELGKKLAPEDLSPAEKEDLLAMLEIHDWPEAIKGDPVILNAHEEEGKKLKAEKFIGEKEAMTEICGKMGEVGKEVFELWMRYERGDDKVSAFAKQLDKYQAILKAFEYEKQQGFRITQEFLDYASRFITHPVLVGKLYQIRKELSELK